MKINLKDFSKKVKIVFIRYVLGLILSKQGKTCSAIALVFGISHDVVYNFLSMNEDLAVLFPNIMISLANHFHKQKPGWLIIDDTSLSKKFAKFIEGVHWVYNSSLGRPEYGFCIVVIAWSNGNITIPIAFDFWFSEEICKETHKTKPEIAQDLINKLGKQVNYTKILADAAYISIDIIDFHKKMKNQYLSRIHSNRKVTICGVCEQIKLHKALRLKGNSRAKITKVLIQGREVNIITFKRFNKRILDYQTVYLITNIYCDPYEIVKMYEGRWNIEPIFRTSKQHLGLALCQAQSIEKQKQHICAVFISYAFVQHEKCAFNLNCAEDAIRMLQASKLRFNTNRFVRFCRDFGCYA